MKKKSRSSKPIKQSVFFFQSWLACGIIVTFVTVITAASNGKVTSDTLYAAFANAIVMGGLLAAVPTAILGSIRKSREKKQSGSGVNLLSDSNASMNTPSAQPSETPQPSSDRPIVVTVICVIGFIGVISVVPKIFTEIAFNIAEWYPPYLALSKVVGFLCMVGLWKMQRKAVFAYTGLCLVNQVVLLATGHWSILALLIPSVFIAIMFSQLSRMK
jgi:hypothetical protein